MKEVTVVPWDAIERGASTGDPGNPGNPDTPESELLGRAQHGDVPAFEALVGRHRDRVFSLVFRMLNSREDAADVTQEVFWAAYRHLDQFRGESQFGSWVHAIAANQGLTSLRRRRLEGPVDDRRRDEADAPSPFVDNMTRWAGRAADDVVLDTELRGAIEAAAASLADDHRAVFVLRDLEGASYAEIAELTQSSVAAVKSRLHRARLSLRSAIGQFYEERL